MIVVILNISFLNIFINFNKFNKIFNVNIVKFSKLLKKLSIVFFILINF